MPVPMLDLKAQYATIKAEVDSVVAEVFTAQQFRGGPAAERFDSAMCAYLECRHALGVSSGTDAILLALRALDLEPGDEVITSPFTFFATAGAIVNAGAVPVFADIDPVTYTLCPERAAACVTPRTRAILPVHLYGQCADMDPLLALAANKGIPVIEDAAQAVGAAYNGRKACSMGLAGALSFYPTKNLGAAGEGGMIMTNDDGMAEKIRLLRCHGSSTTYVHQIVGTNSHLHALQAAVLEVKLRHLEAWNNARRSHAAYYSERLKELPRVVVPETMPGRVHVFHQYVIRLPRRDEARKLFQERGIGCGVFYPIPLHRQECFAPFSGGADCPNADQASREVLALPMYPELTEAQQDEVIAAVRDHVSAG